MTPDLNAGLHTLSFRIDPSGLGNVVLYQLTADFAIAWEEFANKVRAHRGREKITPAYSAVATALTAATGQPVQLFPRSALSSEETSHGVCALLATTAPIDPHIMSMALRVFEQRSLDDFRSVTLAPLLNGVQPQERPFSDFIRVNPGNGTVSTPGWVYDAARWNVSSRICSAPLMVNGRLPLMLRMDTEGNLVAWDRPLSRTARNGNIGHATVWISCRILTLPGATGLYASIDGHVSRHPHSWRFVKTAWLDRGDRDLPLLKMPVLSPWPERGRHLPEFAGPTAEVTEAVGQQPLVLPSEFGADPGSVRPIGNPRRHTIGKGPGLRFLYQLGHHTSEQLGIEPLRYAKTAISVSDQVQGPIPVAQIDSAIAASGTDRLHIACLYSTDVVRRRMVNALGIYAQAGILAIAGTPDDTVTALGPRLTMSLHRAEDLLRHGSHDRALSEISLPPALAGTATAALVETLYDPENPPVDDAKPAVRRLLASHGIISQFINASWTPPKPRRRIAKGGMTVTEPTDEPAIGAARDLFRHAGVIDNRLAAATANPAREGALDREAILVGLHIRQHTPRRKGYASSFARLVIRLTAIHATPDPDVPWRITSYDSAHGSWVSYREASAAYHAGDIGYPELRRARKHYQEIRNLVDEALGAKCFSRDVPMVVFAAAESCSGIWPGLNNPSLGTELVPGQSLDHPDLAVVRCAEGDRVSRPTHRGHGRRSKKDPGKPPLPRATLYEHDEGGTSSWLLTQTSRTYRSSQLSARAGADYTRWTVPESRQSLLGKDWHGLSAVEIAIAKPGSWEPRYLAALTARLCHQAASWDDRTRTPTPLHLAERQDLDHPQRGEQPNEDSN